MNRCQYCGKEIENPRKKTYCSTDCSYNYQVDIAKIRNCIKTVARKNNFDVKNAESITRAKIRFFRGKNLKRCPCDADNPERYCGSPLCITDVINEGHCHCNLFWRKK